MKFLNVNRDRYRNPIEVGTWVLTRTKCVGQIVGWRDEIDRFYLVKYPNDPHEYGFIWSSIEVISEERAMLGILEQS